MRTPSPHLRLFVALDLLPAAKSAIAREIESLRSVGADVGWIDAGNAHLTLKFLGEVEPAVLPRIEDALTRVLWPREVTVGIAGLGQFPSRGRARVIWAGLGGECAALRVLAEAIDGALAECGIAREARPFAPHVTLGRVRGSRGLADLRTEIERRSPTFRIAMPAFRHATLFESRLLAGGALHTVLREFRFR